MVRLRLIHITIVCALFSSCSSISQTTSSSEREKSKLTTSTTFINPILPSGPDPWVIKKDNSYYFTHTSGNSIEIYRTTKMSELSTAPVKTVWIPPQGKTYSKEIWAPEIHYLHRKWYLYFAADDGDNAHHRLYVLENKSADPLAGQWKLRGKVADASDKWAIDATEVDFHGKSYLMWSGWESDTNGQQNIYIAKLANPWTITGKRVLISAPTYDWERQGAPPAVNEGPEALMSPSGKLFVTFSASGCWTDHYAIGLLRLKENGDPLNAADWTKSPTPVFVTNAQNGAYSPGHNGFFISRDGSENWIIYHANAKAGQGCGDERNPRMQKFTWKTNGDPDFGEPVKINTPIRKPSGE